MEQKTSSFVVTDGNDGGASGSNASGTENKSPENRAESKSAFSGRESKLNDPEIELGDIPFPYRRPKDCVSGTSSGVKNILKGVGLGIAALIGAPILGAKEGNVNIFYKLS